MSLCWISKVMISSRKQTEGSLVDGRSVTCHAINVHSSGNTQNGSYYLECVNHHMVTVHTGRFLDMCEESQTMVKVSSHYLHATCHTTRKGAAIYCTY